MPKGSKWFDRIPSVFLNVKAGHSREVHCPCAAD